MSWTKYFKPVNSVLPKQSRTQSSSYASASKYNSWLPEVYAGPPDRLQRYGVYETMALDNEVHAALDTLADFCTESDPESKNPFVFEFRDEPSPNEVLILEKTLKQWCILNDWNKRAWSMFRSTLQYGDQFFIRDPETYKLFWCDPNKVMKVIVNESEGKKIEQYYMRDLDLNLQDLVATNQSDAKGGQFGSTSLVFSPNMGGASNYTAQSYGLPGNNGDSFGGTDEIPVDANHVVQITTSDGMDSAWPFGQSVLESVYKVYKQKELLEDSILIYRVHRAPERRVFFIDVGTMPPNKAQQYLERIRYEVQQKRIPSRTGGGQNIVDSSYNPMCLDLSTRIPLLDGRTLSLSDLIGEYQSGKENWVYSTNPETGKVVPGNITWAGVTKEDAETIELTLDNNETLICTPDHKIPVLGKGFVEAKDLTPDDALISFETREKSLSNDPDRSYTQVYDHEINKWVFTHRMVAEFFRNMNKHQVFVFDEMLKEADKTIVHHRDYNRNNNSPSNLQWMNHRDHLAYHSCVKKEYWENLSEEESVRIKDKIRSSLAQYRSDNPEEFLKRYENRDTSWIQQMKDDDPVKYSKWRESHGKGRSQYLQSNPDALSKFVNKGKQILELFRAKNQEFIFTRSMLNRLTEIVKQHDSNRLETISLVNDDSKFMSLMSDANVKDEKAAGSLNVDKFTNSKLEKMYTEFGYENWKDFKSKLTVYNHRVVNIRSVENRDVGTITVDFDEKWHSYHTFAVESGIFVKNSMLEDYFFAVTSEGRGSKVETLPGGENLGEIDDLRYFNNKMFRALGIPSSYLPTGPEDGTASSSDGRVGTAFIQEYRFSKICKRHQQKVVKPLDEEFKLFLKYKGISIDSSLFELQFTEPQSFSEYRQLELDAAQINVFSSMSDIPYISKRFALKRYLGLSETEMTENERLWKEEKGLKGKPDEDDLGGGALGDAGITPSGIDDMAPDEGFEDAESDDLGADDLGMPDDVSTDEIDSFGDE